MCLSVIKDDKMDLRIRFSDIIPALQDCEYKNLAESIKAEGLRDSIIVWGDIIIDGHNRYKICKENDIAIRTIQKEFSTEEEAKLWIIDNQLARRNLSDWQKYELLSSKREILRIKGKENQGTRTDLLTVVVKKLKHNTRNEIAQELKWSTGKIERADIVEKKADVETKEKLRNNEISIHQVYRDIRKEEKRKIIAKNKKQVTEQMNRDVSDNKPKIMLADYKEFLLTIEDESQDLLITDPPYSTEILNIKEFAKEWLLLALPKLKSCGRTYVCIGAYPVELNAYLSVLLEQDKFIVDNPLIWTYRNTLGQIPKVKYNLNYQVILHLYSKDSRELNTEITNEMFSVQDINAPDGRFGDRYHTWQKPDELARRLIKHSTKEGDEIFDIFAGTGTFLLVGSKMNRKAVGCEISEQNIRIAEERGCEKI